MNLDRLNGVVLDTETGGLDASTCALLEVGLIAVSEGAPIARWHTRVIPHPGLSIEPQAAAVNGYDAATWGGATEREVVYGMVAFLQWVQSVLKRKQLTWIGCNCPFDQGFLQYAAQRHGAHQAFTSCFGFRDVDLTRMAMVPYLSGAIRGVGLDVLRRDLLGLEKRGVHSALLDCEDTLQCLHAFMQRCTWA